MIAPHFFGNMADFVYWGRCLLWEMLPTIGVVGLTLALYGIFRGRRRARRWSLVMAALMLMLALGRHTALYSLLYHYVPGFSSVRGMSKFTYYFALFLALLAGAGLDHLLRTRRVPWGLLAGVTAAVLVVGGLGFHLALMPEEAISKWWVGAMRWVTSDKESFVAVSSLKLGTFVRDAAHFAGGGLLLAAATFLALGAVLLAARFFPAATPLLVLLAVGESFVFARSMRPTFPFALTRIPVGETAEGLAPGDRTLYPQRPDCAMSLGHGDIWGYGPFVSRRYAEFMALTQGAETDQVVQYIEFTRMHPLHVMLRARFFIFEEGGRLLLRARSNGFPEALLVRDYKIADGRNAVFAAMRSSDFNARRTVILEQDPGIPAASGPPVGSARVVERGTDHLLIEAETPEPAILLVTDAFASGWRAADAGAGPAQRTYTILPANYVLRAVPLAAGSHRIRLEYLPPGLRAGLAISVSAAILFAFLAARLLLSFRRESGRRHVPDIKTTM